VQNYARLLAANPAATSPGFQEIRRAPEDPGHPRLQHGCRQADRQAEALKAERAVFIQQRDDAAWSHSAIR